MAENIERKILDLFLYNNKLRFSEIEKALKIRSNKISYHLSNLIKKKILIKKDFSYELTEDFEYLIPYLSDKQAVLPVILIHLCDKRKVFLYKREKRPYKNFLSLPGGRILVGESIKNAVKRIMKEKFNINANLKGIKSVSLEHISNKKKIMHSFLLILVSADTKDEVNLTEVNKNRKKIIPSDYKLIKSDGKININTIYSKQ